ncbi:MAG: acyltransferase [Anaerolineae bacterium]|nr:acyltransferase [Gloeobacterales cyanobacterium ES-bin-313]
MNQKKITKDVGHERVAPTFKSSRYKTLDLWRGFSALWVMTFHSFATVYSVEQSFATQIIKFLANPGWLGVHIFFVISGYCVAANAHSLLRKQQTSFQFLGDRFLRILPTYWSSILATVAISIIAIPLNHTKLLDNLPNSLTDWIANIFLIQPYLHVEPYVVVYWSLAVEVGFYLLVALLYDAYQRIHSQEFSSKLIDSEYKLFLPQGFFRKVLSQKFILHDYLLFFVSFVFTIACKFEPLQSFGTVINLWPEFYCGILAFLVLHFWDTERIKSYFLLAFIIFFGFLGFVEHLQWSTLSFSSMIACSLCLLYIWDNRLAKMRTLSWLKHLGTMSYSLYLLHVPILGRVINLGNRYIELKSPYYLLLHLVGWLITISVCYVFYRVVEKPFQDWRYSLKQQASQR